MNFLSPDSMLGRFFNLVFDLVILHLLWLLCSLPIVTIGASTTALYYSLMKRTRTNEGYPWRNYLRSFKSNFKQATIIWLILLFVGAFLYADIRIGITLGSTIGKMIVFSTSCLLIPYILICLYIFPVQAKFENPVLLNFKNALLMSIANFGYTVLMLLLLVIIIFTLLVSRLFFGLFLTCGVGLTIWLLSNFFIIIFRKYLPDEYESDLEISGTNNIR